MRFTIRDLCWLTAIVALVLGWTLREMYLRVELANADQWRLAAGALEHALEMDGWRTQWGTSDGTVTLAKDPKRSQFKDAAMVHISPIIGEHEPSARQPN